MTDYKPGDKVRGKYSGETLEVLANPEGVRVRYPDGKEAYVSAKDIESLPTDPRREVVAKAYVNAGDEDVWSTLPLLGQQHALMIADAVLAALDAMPGARYRDREYDVWVVQPDGRPMLVQYADGDDVAPGCYKADVSELERAYGPLTRI